MSRNWIFLLPGKSTCSCSKKQETIRRFLCNYAAAKVFNCIIRECWWHSSTFHSFWNFCDNNCATVLTFWADSKQYIFFLCIRISIASNLVCFFATIIKKYTISYFNALLLKLRFKIEQGVQTGLICWNQNRNSFR